MAQVLEALACGLDGFERRVAIKRLLPEHAGDEERRRLFFEEARLGSRLHHGGIVPIFDYGLIDGSEFLAMDFVDGLDALRAITGTASAAVPMSEGIALHVTAEVAHALAYVHDLRDDEGRAAGVVHRDVSPPNILLSWDGDVRLCDFGIAFSGRRRDEPTLGGAVKGKLHYMAPEQARGERVTSAADVYALGATLDALTGGGALAPVRSDSSGDARAVAARARGLSAPVGELIRECLSTDPTSRPRAEDIAARAGALASQRLGCDGRTALVGWLRPLRSLKLRRSKLDDLMGLCLVSVGPPEARTLTVTTIGQRPPRAERPGRRIAGFRPAGRRFSTLLVSGTLIASAVAVGLGAGRVINQLRGKGAFAAPLAEPAAPDLAPRISSSVPVAPPGEPSPQPLASFDPLPSEALSSSPAEPVPEPMHPRRPSARGHGDPAASSAHAEAPATGWLRVGGAKLAGARVSIDHATAGFAPLELEVPIGSHAVVVTSLESGRVLARATVRVTEDSTRSVPARLLR